MVEDGPRLDLLSVNMHRWEEQLIRVPAWKLEGHGVNGRTVGHRAQLEDGKPPIIVAP